VMLRVISEHTLGLRACFTDWQKAFDRVNETKLMRILGETGIDWRKRRLIMKLNTDRRVKARLDRRETRSVKIGREVSQGRCFSRVCSSCTVNMLTREALKGL
jgi:hypothetical protein